MKFENGNVGISSFPKVLLKIAVFENECLPDVISVNFEQQSFYMRC